MIYGFERNTRAVYFFIASKITRNEIPAKYSLLVDTFLSQQTFSMHLDTFKQNMFSRRLRSQTFSAIPRKKTIKNNEKFLIVGTIIRSVIIRSS